MNLDDYVVFRNHKRSLQYTSQDTSKQPIQFMCYSNTKVVDLDAVKSSIASEVFKTQDDIARSADALLETSNGLYIIEFKNGDFNGIEISQKAYNSILLFNFITSKQIDYTRNNVSFVLVYNKEANKIKNMNWAEKLSLSKAKSAKDGIRLFGTDKLKHFSYKAVYMLEKAEVNEFINEMGIC